jgi:hypothetical protein
MALRGGTWGIETADRMAVLHLWNIERNYLTIVVHIEIHL